MDKKEFKIYKIDDFREIKKVNKITNFSKVYSAILAETSEKVILKYFIHSTSLDITEHITKEIIINKHLSDNTDITVDFKGICIDEQEKFMGLSISIEEKINFVNKNLELLKSYNSKIKVQLNNQKKLMNNIDSSIKLFRTL